MLAFGFEPRFFTTIFHRAAATLLVTAACAALAQESRFQVDKTPLDRSAHGAVLSYAPSIAKARPAVVSVYSKSFGDYTKDELHMQYLVGEEPSRERSESHGLGSGVIVSKDGYILTNVHVVDKATELKVQLDNGRIYDAQLVGADRQTDVALIKIDAANLVPAVFADSDALEVGDVVFAIGNPLGVGKTVTMGIVSATGRHALIGVQGSYEDFIQTDAPIHPGNSGGALIDARGRLIGISTLIRTNGQSSGSVGIGFAVPANLALGVVSDLIESGSVSRGFLGVGLEALDAEKAALLGLEDLKGALVTQVQPGSAAAGAGLKEGDVIIAIGGKSVDSPNALRLAVSQKKPGSQVEIVYLREGRRASVEAVLAALGEVSAKGPEKRVATGNAMLEGVTLEPVSEALVAQYELDASVKGVVVTALSPGSRYAEKLAEGMVILRVNKPEVATAADVSANLIAGSRNMLLVAYRGVYRWIALDLPEMPEGED